MQGTPWHIKKRFESHNNTLKQKEKCLYYKNGKCNLHPNWNLECYIDEDCENYDKVYKAPKHTPKASKIYEYKKNKTIKGSFTLFYYDDNETVIYTIGDNIKNDAPIIEKIKKIKSGNNFEFNGEKIKLISKRLF